MADGEKQPLTVNQQTQEHKQSCFLKYVGHIARLWGLATLAVIWAATVTLLQGDYKDAPEYAPYYLLAVSILVTFFELTWIIDKLACCVREGCCCRCWAVILWVDKWRKFLLYTAISVPLFLQGVRVLIGVISGFCLLLLACLYLVKSFSSMLQARKTDAAQKAPEVVRHEMSTQTERVSTNPFEEEEWSEEETPKQRRQRQQREKDKEQQQQKEQEEKEKEQQRQKQQEQAKQDHQTQEQSDGDKTVKEDSAKTEENQNAD